MERFWNLALRAYDSKWWLAAYSPTAMAAGFLAAHGVIYHAWWMIVLAGLLCIAVLMPMVAGLRRSRRALHAWEDKLEVALREWEKRP